MSKFNFVRHYHDKTALIAASFNGNVKIVRYLLENNADPTLEACMEGHEHQSNFFSCNFKVYLNTGIVTDGTYFSMM